MQELIDLHNQFAALNPYVATGIAGRDVLTWKGKPVSGMSEAELAEAAEQYRQIIESQRRANESNDRVTKLFADAKRRAP